MWRARRAGTTLRCRYFGATATGGLRCVRVAVGWVGGHGCGKGGKGGLWAGVLAAALAAVGCGDDVAPKAPDVRLARGPVQPAPAQNGPLPDTPDGVEHSPLTLEAPPVGYRGRRPRAGDLGRRQRLGAGRDHSRRSATWGRRSTCSSPASAPTLTASQLATGTHGKYNAIILTRGNLVLSNGTSAFSTAEFQTLATYEATFQVRRVSLYTSPDAGYGYSGSTSQDTSSTPLATQCTTAGRAVFPYVNCNNGVTISGAFAYRATALGRVDGAAADRLERAHPGRDARLRRRPRGAVAELRAVAQPVPHAAAVSRRRQLGDARRVPGRAPRVHRRPDRRSLPARRHLHRRHVPDERAATCRPRSTTRTPSAPRRSRAGCASTGRSTARARAPATR